MIMIAVSGYRRRAVDHGAAVHERAGSCAPWSGCSPLGFLAVLAGWFTAEVGRQPWVVYGVLRTADAVSPVPGGSVLASILLFVLVYGVVFGAGLYLHGQAREARTRRDPADAGGRRRQPFASAHGGSRQPMTP